MLVSAYLDCPEVYSSYFRNKSYNEKIEWIKKLKTDNLDSKDKVELFSVFNPTIENINYFEEILGEEIRIYWESCTFENPEDETALQYVFKKLIDYGVPQKAFNIINDWQISIKRLPPEWIFDVLVSIENYGECSIPKYMFANLYSYLFGQLDDGKLEKLEFLSFKLYGRISYNHGYNDLEPRDTLKKIVNEPEFFIEVVNDVMNDSLGLGISFIMQ